MAAAFGRFNGERRDVLTKSDRMVPRHKALNMYALAGQQRAEGVVKPRYDRN